MLQEGSRVVMVLCATSDSQGVYGLVTNLGSLVVRTLFQPLEEAAFLAFSQPHISPNDPGSMQPHGHMASSGKVLATSSLTAEGSLPFGAVQSSTVDGGMSPLQGGMSSKAGHERQQRALLSALMKVALLAGMTLHVQQHDRFSRHEFLFADDFIAMLMEVAAHVSSLSNKCPCCCTL